MKQNSDQYIFEAPLGIDVKSVGHWLVTNVENVRPPLRFTRLTGGHSCLTYLITDECGYNLVLRRPPVGELLATAHDVIREYKIMAALAGHVPVPRMLAACNDAAVTGAAFYVMEFVRGLVLNSTAQAKELLPSMEARRRAGETLIDALAALHSIDVEAVGLDGLSKKSGYLQRQLKRWSAQPTASGSDHAIEMERLHDWLIKNQPHQAEGRIVHGDFRLGNVIVSATGSILAILDWELCTLGDPLADLAYAARSWSTADLRTLHGGVLESTPGFLTRDHLLHRYAEQTSRSLEDIDYWMSFTAWRAAAILAGVYNRYIAGDMGPLPANFSMFLPEIQARIDQALGFAHLLS